MRRMKTFVIGGLALAALAAAGGAAAQEGEAVKYLTCESKNNGHNECRYTATGIVTVHVSHQKSSSPCTFNESWGTFDGGVWVDYGCRAEFVVRRPPQTNNYSPRPIGGTQKYITCESKKNRHNVCRVDGIDPRSVHIERKLSSAPCEQGYSWGASSGENSPPGIWVDRGCRATFSYSMRGGSYTPYGGTPHDFNLDCVSEMSEWRHCEVPRVHLARVELARGNNQCYEYKAWGVDDTGVWVRSNCMGNFRVIYRH